MKFQARMPWWAKVASKLLLSRIPTGYAAWQWLGLFRHGHMDDPDYAYGVFRQHVDRAGFKGDLAGKVILELGPGDSVATAVIARAHGARAILVDAGRYAKSKSNTYQRLTDWLSEAGLNPPDLSGTTTLDRLLDTCHASYLTKGLASLQALPDASIDLVLSHAVLEHVRRREFLAMQKELFRVLKPGGICSHRVDLRDHLGGGLNNLRFSERVWESSFFATSGFYTNRINHASMQQMFSAAGFSVDVRGIQSWPALPIARKHLATEFRNIPDDVLMVSGFDAILRLPN